MTSKAKGGGGKVKGLKDALGKNKFTEVEIIDTLAKHHDDENAAFIELQQRDTWSLKPKRDKPKKEATRVAAVDQAAPAPGGRGAGRGRSGPGGRGGGRGGGRDTQGFEGGRRGRRDGPPAGPGDRRDGPPRQQRREEPAAPAPEPGVVDAKKGGTVTSYAPVRDTPVGTSGRSFADIFKKSAPVQQAVPQSVPQPEPTPTFAEPQPPIALSGAWAQHQAQAQEAANADPVVEPEQPAAPEPVSDGWGPPAVTDTAVPEQEDAPEPIAPVQTEEEEVPAAADPVVAEVQSAPVPTPHQPSPYRPPQAAHHDIAPAPALENHQAHRYRPSRNGPDVKLPATVAQWADTTDAVSFGFSPAAPDLSEGLGDSNGARATPPSGTPNMPPQIPVANSASLLPENVSLVHPQNAPGNSISAANGTSAQSRAQPQSMPSSQPPQGHHASHMPHPHQAMPPHQSQQAGPPRQQQHGQQHGQGRAQHGQQHGLQGQQGAFPNSAVGQGQSMQGMMQGPGGYNFDYEAASMQFPTPSSGNSQMSPGENFYNNAAAGSVQGNMGPGFQGGYPQTNRQGAKNFPNHDPMGKQGMNQSPHPHVPNMPGGQQSGMASQAYPYQHMGPYYHMAPQMMPGQFPGMPPYQGQVGARGGYGGYGYPGQEYGMGYMGAGMTGAGYGSYGGGDEKMGQFYGASSGQDNAAPGGKGFSGPSGAGNPSGAAKSQPMSSSPAKEMGSNFAGFGNYGPGNPHLQQAAYASGN